MNAPALLAKLFRFSTRDMVDSALHEAAIDRGASGWAKAETRSVLTTMFDNVGFRTAVGKWKQPTVLLRIMIEEEEHQTMEYFTFSNAARGLNDVVVRITREAYTMVRSAEQHFLKIMETRLCRLRFQSAPRPAETEGMSRWQ